MDKKELQAEFEKLKKAAIEEFQTAKKRIKWRLFQRRKQGKTSRNREKSIW